MEIIWRALYFYFNYQVSLRQVKELLLDRGISLSHVSIYNWILKFGPELETKFRRHKRPIFTSWKLDETYIKINGKDKYLYRAVDKKGQTIDFLLTAKRDTKAAKRFLKKAIRQNGQPAKITIDGSHANKAGIRNINKEKNPQIEIRTNKYLNNLIEQDHRNIKKHTKQKISFRNFHSAKIILYGIEILNMIRKNQTCYMPLFYKTPHESYWALVV